jgi:calcium/calmodulin-dependent protein kinase (CaM kinase) II
VNDPLSEELLRLNQRLLECIGAADWDTYRQLCDPSLTAFEPEAAGHLVEGLDFHAFYFRLGGFGGPHQTTMVSPRVRIMGDTAVIAYVRLDQRLDSAGTPSTRAIDETRIWQKQNGTWRHVHFHRSNN